MDNLSANITRTKEDHPILLSTFAFGLYFVLILFFITRQIWVLHGITVLILLHIADILLSWFSHIKDAKEIRQFKSWLVWWVRIGLDFATRTVEGQFTHRVLTAGSLHFWDLIGKSYTINWFDDIAQKGRKNVLNQAKDGLNQSKINQQKFANSLRDSLKRKSG